VVSQPHGGEEMNKVEQRKAVYQKYGGHCAYCGKEISLKDMQVDHFEPKCIKGPIGKDIDGKYIFPDLNVFSNLMPSCSRCNHYKRANDIEYFRYMIKTIHERIHDNYIVKVAWDFGIIKYNKWDEMFYFERIDRR
jgi:5-methylcytosine-specific restriction endonuclease McrA